MFWYSETDILPAHLTRLLPGCVCRVPAPRDGFPPAVPTRGEDEQPLDDDEIRSVEREEGSSAVSRGDPEEYVQSQDSFETATSQGYRAEEEEAQEVSVNGELGMAS